VRRLDGDIKVPAKSTIHAVLNRHGLVKRGGGPRHRARGTPLCAGAGPNDLWCADFKGEFKLGNGPYCYPLTVTDHASRFLLLCEALDSTREDPAITAFERLFRERGLPLAIRSDNGVPFASANALFNLSKLSVWWLRRVIESLLKRVLGEIGLKGGDDRLLNAGSRNPDDRSKLGSSYLAMQTGSGNIVAVAHPGLGGMGGDHAMASIVEVRSLRR
jgi:hypothetical protein